jgi:hypothetical protein
LKLRRAGATGFVAKGRFFYVWERDRMFVERWAEELAAAERPAAPARRAAGRRVARARTKGRS